ncbi:MULTISPECIES: chemotaxis protein CheB [unclassified Caballeronia]|uniref:chemotaxis protein CheB n=1 Tax=unclassified Caballeronia TaxID=2646786 RepID=UPI00158B4278|nr:MULTISPECIES: chemotaxis protein CheB [unclassified Caballeronia]QSN63048.1 chemotaxis protein CheB [Caballeronia sp. M1242]
MDARIQRDIVVIGASAGGVPALGGLLARLPAQLPATLLIVMHISPYGPSALHTILARTTNLRVVAATDNAPLAHGTVFVATTDRHLMLSKEGVRITRGPKECRARPAVDVLFRSAAVTYGERVIGVILTGALDDGTAGLWAVKDHGGLAFVQDPLTADHPSMPESAIAHVEVDFVGDLDALADKILSTVVTPAGSPTHRVSARAYAAIENKISETGDGGEASFMKLGNISRYTCPDCNGVLMQIEEGPIVRFRCHTGHAFSIQTLIAEIDEAIDGGLWTTLRAIEERIMLLRQMADLAERAGSALDAAAYREQADEAEKRLAPLRQLVLDPDSLGHAPAG